jgi:ribose transport system ATP-binding protein
LSGKVLLKAQEIDKSFGITHALDHVTIEIGKGDVMGLIGENGSGKSTFSSIISGIQKADSGTIVWKGQEFRPQSMVEAQVRGISIVVQEMGTVPGISVAQNIFLGNEKDFRKGLNISRKTMTRKAAELLARVGMEWVDPEEPIDRLSFEDRKLVEIARALYGSPDLFIFDETTTALSQKGRDVVYKIVEEYRQENKAVLFISHDLDELIHVSTKVTVLRDGKMVAVLGKSEMSPEKIKELMVGRKITEEYYRTDYKAEYGDEVVLRAKHLTAGSVLEDFSMELHKGEILGIGGLTDCGMHDLGKALFGLIKPLTGSVTVLPQNRQVKNAYFAIRNKIGYVPKNRDQEALDMNASIRDNITLPSLGLLTRWHMISKKKEKQFAADAIKSLRIKCSSDMQLCKSLSGGNKQKVSVAKWLGNRSKIYIFDCPTRGIDVIVKAALYQLMVQLKAQGKSIVMISEELTELIGMCDRIMILKDGKLSGTFERSKELTDHMLIQKMV